MTQSLKGNYTNFPVCSTLTIDRTRQPSCVGTERGEPPMLYHVQASPVPVSTPSCPGWEGEVPHPGQGISHPILAGSILSCLGWGGYPILSWPKGYPILSRLEYPTWDWGTPKGDMGPVTRVPSRKDMGPVEVLWDGAGAPLERTWDQWKYYIWNGVGIPPSCGLTNKLKTYPFRSFRCGQQKCHFGQMCHTLRPTVNRV